MYAVWRNITIICKINFNIVVISFVCLNQLPIFQFFRKKGITAEYVNMLCKSNVEKDDNILDYCDEACCDYLGISFECVWVQIGRRMQ